MTDHVAEEDIEIIDTEEEFEDEVTAEYPAQVSTWMRIKLAAYLVVGRFAFKWLPFLMQECPFGNKHWSWQRLCACGFDEPSEDGSWHGGLCDLAHGNELLPCLECHPENSQNSHHWKLTNEEEHLLVAWRSYRSEVLDKFGEKNSYTYELNVKLNNVVDTFLMGRRQGMPSLESGRGILASVRPKNPKTDKPN